MTIDLGKREDSFAWPIGYWIVLHSGEEVTWQGPSGEEVVDQLDRTEEGEIFIDRKVVLPSRPHLMKVNLEVTL